MLGHVWSWAGEFRKSKRNIEIKWINIGSDLKTLLDDSKFCIENEIYQMK